MGSIHLRRVGALVFAAALMLGACSSAPGGTTSDPVGAVQAAYAAIGSGGLTKMSDYVCAAKKGDLLSAFGSGGTAQLTAAGIKGEDLLAAMSVTFANVVVTQTAKTDTTATVTVTGDQTIAFDKDKMRAIMKTVLTAQGKPTDDATLDLVMNALSSQLTQARKMNDTVKLVNEGGKWLICG